MIFDLKAFGLETLYIHREQWWLILLCLLLFLLYQFLHNHTFLRWKVLIVMQGCLFAAMIRPPRSPKLQSDLEHSFESSESYSSLGGKLESIETETAVSPPNRGLCNSIKPILHWRVGALVTGNLLWGSAMSVFFVLFPDLAKLNGLTSQQTSMILTISGAMGTVGRIGCSALGTSSSSPPRWYRPVCDVLGVMVLQDCGRSVQLFSTWLVGMW